MGITLVFAGSGALVSVEEDQAAKLGRTDSFPGVSSVFAGSSWGEPVWAEEFLGPSGSQPSKDVWKYQTGRGYVQPDGEHQDWLNDWGNGEQQVYTDDPLNASLDGEGSLRITPTRDERGQWYSARLESQQDNFEPPAKGMLAVEARIKRPDTRIGDVNRGSGIWPAFWMLGSGTRYPQTYDFGGTKVERNTYLSWPTAGEIDIMEGVQTPGSLNNPLAAEWNTTNVSTVHCGFLVTPGTEGYARNADGSLGPCREFTGIRGASQAENQVDLSQDFHTYRVEWDDSREKEEIRFFLDGTQFHTVTVEDVNDAGPHGSAKSIWDKAFSSGQFLVLNVAVGGAFPDGADGDAGDGSPDWVNPVQFNDPSMSVDYVRVYRQDTSEPDLAPPAKSKHKVIDSTHSTGATACSSSIEQKDKFLQIDEYRVRANCQKIEPGVKVRGIIDVENAIDKRTDYFTTTGEDHSSDWATYWGYITPLRAALEIDGTNRSTPPQINARCHTYQGPVVTTQRERVRYDDGKGKTARCWQAPQDMDVAIRPVSGVGDGQSTVEIKRASGGTYTKQIRRDQSGRITTRTFELKSGDVVYLESPGMASEGNFDDAVEVVDVSFRGGEQVLPAVTLTASATTLSPDQPVLFTTHLPADATGYVGFYDEDQPGTDKGIGTAPIINGVATLTAPTKMLAPGQHRISASYGGDERYRANDSNKTTITVTGPAVRLSASHTQVPRMGTIRLTATVPDDATGTITFTQKGTGRSLGTVPVTNGTAQITFTTSPTGPQEYTFTATYNGDNTYTHNTSNPITIHTT